METTDQSSVSEEPEDIKITKLLWKNKKTIFLLLPFLFLQGQNREEHDNQAPFSQIIASARLEMERDGIPAVQNEGSGFFSDFIYERIGPWGGDFANIIDKIRTESPEKRQFYKKMSPEKEALWKLYLGVPLDENERKLVMISDYKPAKSEEKIFYYRLPRYDDAVFRFFKNNFWKWQQEKYEDFSSEYVFDPKSLLEEINDDFERESAENRFNVASFALGGFKIELGVDEKGKYISYYDLWDLEAMGISVTPFIGKPLEIYNRIYYEEIGGEAQGNPGQKIVVGVKRIEQ